MVIKYKCKKCNIEKEVIFENGVKPEAPFCENCKEKMKRLFSQVEVGDVISDMMIHYGQSAIYS